MVQPHSHFIVLEGIDGAGTTTQTRRLAERLRQDGCQVVTTCEPSSGPVGNLIRQALEQRLRLNSAEALELDWATLALLFAADRTDHVSRCIEPALRSGAHVICDRYDLSSCIYQSLTSPDPKQALRWVQDLNCQVRRPDLTLVLDIDPDVAEIRRSKRGTEPELFERRSLQQRLAVAYQESQSYVPNDRLVHLDGELSIAEVTVRLHDLCRTLE
jgi:dTMP kinase